MKIPASSRITLCMDECGVEEDVSARTRPEQRKSIDTWYTLLLWYFHERAGKLRPQFGRSGTYNGGPYVFSLPASHVYNSASEIRYLTDYYSRGFRWIVNLYAAD